MRDTPAEALNLQLVIHNDDQTPWEFVVDLVRSIFDRSIAEAETLAATYIKSPDQLNRAYGRRRESSAR